jgi:hypothetical protein
MAFHSQCTARLVIKRRLLTVGSVSCLYLQSASILKQFFVHFLFQPFQTRWAACFAETVVSSSCVAARHLKNSVVTINIDRL